MLSESPGTRRGAQPQRLDGLALVCHHLGVAAGLWRLDKRLYEAIQDTLTQARTREDEDYREIKRKIDELTQDLPELREIMGNLVDAGISAQRA